MAFPLPAAALAALLVAAQPPGTVPVPAPDAPAAADDDPASTAVGLRDSDTRMTVQVMIDGAGPFRFIVDSGATRTVVSRQLAATLRLPSAGRVSLHSVGGESEVDTVRIAGMTLGGLPARPIVAPVLEAANLGAAGILGIDALVDKKVVIDMDRLSMSVVPAKKEKARVDPDAIVVSARRRFGQLVLADADAMGERVYAVVDTGSMITIGNSLLQTSLIRRRHVGPERLTITDVTGRAIVASYATIGHLRIGPWAVTGVRIAFSDIHAFTSFGLAGKPALLLGMDLMRAFSRVSIDFRHRQVELLRRHDAA